MKLIKFILQKIVIVEVMLIILYFACSLFGVNIHFFNIIINTGLKYLTKISVIALLGYIILSLLTNKIIETIIGVVLGSIILYYLFNYII